MGKLYLISGDIIENSKNMDTIVNAQNKYMINGSGICGAIYRSAGIRLLEYCKNNYDKPMEPCEIRVTPGFNLNMPIIHVFAPISREWDNPVEKLVECYQNVLETIRKQKYKRIIIPSLGTGIHGYKHEEVAEKIIKELLYFCENNDVEIYFVNRLSIVTNEYLNAILNMEEFDIDEVLKMLTCEESCFEEFVDGKSVDDMCIYEKLIYSKVKNKNIEI